MIARRSDLPMLMLLAISGASLASAQAPLPPSPTPTAPVAPQSSDPAVAPKISDPYMPQYSSRSYRSRTAPQPRYEDPDSDYGYRNPGGVGRMEEFYPPGNKFQTGGRNPVQVAQFGSGSPALSREAQLQSQQVGIARSRELHEHMDNYSRPLGGFGYGYGFGSGFGVRFPF